MPPKSQPAATKRATRGANLSRSTQVEPQGLEGGDEYAGMSAAELIRLAMERNADPVIGRILLAAARKIPADISEALESEKRSRSIVIRGLEEAVGDISPFAKQTVLEEDVGRILEVLDVECRPTEVYRMGRPNPQRPRLVKVVLPSPAHWRRALANARLLRTHGFPHVFIRRSMTADERRRDYELRQEARERNKGGTVREWVVYRGELRRASDLPRSTENL